MENTGAITTTDYPFLESTSGVHMNVTFYVSNEDPFYELNSMKVLDVSVTIIGRGVFAAAGVVFNIINIIVFLKIGLKDSMSVGLLALSIADFILCLLAVAGGLCFLLDAAAPEMPVDFPPFESVTVGWKRDIQALVSNWITALLSVERSMCVISPFKVKQIFTRSRCLVAVILIYVVNYGLHIPVFANQGLAWVPMPVGVHGNQTRYRSILAAWYSGDRDAIGTYINITNGSVLQIPCVAIVVVSIIWMTVGLRRSSQIRSDMTEGGADGKSENKSKLSAKESRLVTVMVFLAVILLVCSIPRIVVIYIPEVMPEIGFTGRYKSLYIFLWNVATCFATLNASVNIFIYLAVNSMYRSVCREIFCRKG